MAKKNAAKTAKKAAKKKARGAAAEEAPVAETSSCTDQELQAAGVVASAGELFLRLFAEEVLRALEARGIDLAELFRTVGANLERSQPSERVSGDENSERAWGYNRRRLVRRDYADMPYLRFVGRVMEVLLNHRRFQTCTAGDVLKVFLVEIPSHLEVNHRQDDRRPGQEVDITRQPARRTFNNRMKRLREEELIRPTVMRETGREEGYVLTEDGQNMFCNWPELSEIPGLELDGPVRP